MKYFLYAYTTNKPVMRFFEHWFEVHDFLNLMNWNVARSDFPIFIYKTIADVPTEKDPV